MSSWFGSVSINASEGDVHTEACEQSRDGDTPTSDATECAVEFVHRDAFLDDFVLIDTHGTTHYLNCTDPEEDTQDAHGHSEHQHNSFPEELLLRTLEWLDVEEAMRLRVVCKRWNRIIGSRLWAWKGFTPLHASVPLHRSPAPVATQHRFVVGVHGTVDNLVTFASLVDMTEETEEVWQGQLEDSRCRQSDGTHAITLLRVHKHMLATLQVVFMTHERACQHNKDTWGRFDAHILLMDLRNHDRAEATVRRASKLARRIQHRDNTAASSAHIAFFGLAPAESCLALSTEQAEQQMADESLVESFNSEAGDWQSSDRVLDTEEASKAAQLSLQQQQQQGEHVDNRINAAQLMDGLLHTLKSRHGFDVVPDDIPACANDGRSTGGSSSSSSTGSSTGSALAGAGVFAVESALYVPTYFLSGVAAGALKGSQMVDQHTYQQYGMIAVVPQLASAAVGAVAGGVSGLATGVYVSVTEGVSDGYSMATRGKVSKNESVMFGEISAMLLESLGVEVDVDESLADE